jgi:transcription elongation GreA/GreB family factor
MKDYLKIKKKITKACLLFVEEKENTVTNSIESNKKAMFSETKSSAGDKHETGRAMLQLEMEKAGQQLAAINQMKEIMKKVAVESTSGVACLGSLVVTDKGNYYLAIGMGNIAIDSIEYYAVSTNSPIGRQLLGKSEGDSISFNNALILKII